MVVVVVVVILSRPGHQSMQPELAYHPTERVIVHPLSRCFFHHRKPVSPMIQFRMLIRIKQSGTLRACPAAVLPLSHTLPLAASSGWLVGHCLGLGLRRFTTPALFGATLHFHH